MKTLIAVVFGMVLDQLLLWTLYRSVKAKRGEMLQFRGKNGTTWIDASEIEITVADGYDATMEGNKITIRKRKNDGKE